jgi:hypothetical protein
MTSKSRSHPIIFLKDVLQSSDHPDMYYAEDALKKRMRMLKECLLGIQKSMGILQNPNIWYDSYNNDIESIKNIVYFLNYFTFLWFCCNHMNEILIHLQKQVCENAQSDYLSKLNDLKEKWENISFQNLNPILENFLNKIKKIYINDFNIFHDFLLKKTREIYNKAVEKITGNIFLNNNSIFIINLKYNTTYLSVINDKDRFHLNEIDIYIDEIEFKINVLQNQINSLFENLGKIESLDQKCQKIAVKHPKLFMKNYHANRLYMNQYPELIKKIFSILLREKKSLSLPKKERNITLRQTRSYGGSKRKSRRSR